MPPASTRLPFELTPASIQGFFDDLSRDWPAADASADAWEAAFWRWNDYKGRLATELTHRHWRAAQDTRNEAAEAAMREAREQLIPVFEAASARIRRVVLEAPCRAELVERLGPVLFARFETEDAGFTPENLGLQTEEADHVARYQRLVGRAEIPLGDETLTLPQLNARLTQADAQVRQAAWGAITGWTNTQRAEFHALYDRLIGIRTQMARNLGHENFVALGYQRMGRSDYGPEQVAGFREAIRTSLSPLLVRLREAQARMLGNAAVIPPDMAFFPGLSLGANVAPIGEQLIRAQQLFDRLHPKLAGHFRRMVREGLIDLENRPGKQPGAFCVTFDAEETVGIFCNSTGAESDVTTLVHEMGHAFQGWESQWIGPLELRWPTMDAAEIHSMGLEFLTLKEIGAFFSAEDARRYRRLKLINTLTRLPYMAVVDAFQHWVYAHPEHSHTEREDHWEALWEQFIPGVDWSGEADAKRTRWMRQQHIFSSPFYYIDYAIAEVGAMQLWQMAERNHTAALDAYLTLCGIGGSRTVLGIFEAGGLRSPFEPGVLKPLADALVRELDL